MTITLDTAEQASRQTLEALVLEAYRNDRLTGPEGAKVLGFSRMRWETFLAHHHVVENTCSVEDLRRDVAALRSLRETGVFPPVS